MIVLPNCTKKIVKRLDLKQNVYLTQDVHPMINHLVPEKNVKFVGHLIRFGVKSLKKFSFLMKRKKNNSLQNIF